MTDDELDRILGIPNARECAEARLIELMRGEDAKAFMLTVTCSDGRWMVVIEGLDDAARGIGEGTSFAEAWHKIDPSRARPA